MSHLLLMLIFILLLVFIARITYSIILLPWIISRHFHKQGIRGPSYCLIKGNSDEIRRMFAEVQSKPMDLCHDIVHRVCPSYHRWAPLYGKIVLSWYGSEPRLIISDPVIIKEALLKTGELFEKLEPNPSLKRFYGEGILFSKGKKWTVYRSIASHAFKMEHSKSWIPQIIDTTKLMFCKWEDENNGIEEFEIDVNKDLQKFSADVISKVAFGSSYEEGKEIFKLQDQHCHLASLSIRTAYFPGFRYIPTKKNRERKRIEKKTRELIKVLIDNNHKTQNNSENLLALLMSPHKFINNETQRLGLDEIIDNCKNFYLTGKETIANSVSWAIFLLGLNQEWQSKAREEVFHVLGHHTSPTAETLSDLKLVSLVIQETLRLYPVAAVMVRQASKRVNIGNIDILAGTQLYMSIISVHHDTQIWGEDAIDFNPMRFTKSQKHSSSYFPFGFGPNYCVGQNLALIEMKIVLAMLLQRYSFTVSPTYVHGPKRHMMSSSPNPAKKPKLEIITTNPNWLELPKDLTSNILKRLGAVEILTNARNVCPYWWNICKDPFMWREIQMGTFHLYFQYANADAPDLDYLVKLCQYAVDLSSGHLEKIDIYRFGSDHLLQYIADRASNLRHIQLASCMRVSDEGWCEAAKKFPLLEEIDISHGFQTKISLEVIGQNCPLLKSLVYNGMSYGGRSKCDEAFIIAKTMPGLRHLDIHKNPLTDDGLLAILDGCPLLESLNIAGCYNLDFDGSLWERLHNHIKDLHLREYYPGPYYHSFEPVCVYADSSGISYYEIVEKFVDPEFKDEDSDA